MSDYSLTFGDHSFSLSKAYLYNFLMLVGSNTFSFAIIEQDKLMAWADNLPIGDLISPKGLAEVFNAPYQHKTVGFSSSGFTLIPNALFSAAHVADLARLLDVRPTDKVFTAKFDLDNYVVYKVSDNITHAVSVKFDLEKAVFGANGWIKKVSESMPSVYNLYMNLVNKSVELLYLKNGKLRLFNRFDAASDDDQVYFALMICRELKMEPKGINLVLSGNVNEGDKVINRLRAFFKSVSMTDLQVLSLPPQVPSHQILPLAALSLCASLVEN